MLFLQPANQIRQYTNSELAFYVPPTILHNVQNINLNYLISSIYLHLSFFTEIQLKNHQNAYIYFHGQFCSLFCYT